MGPSPARFLGYVSGERRGAGAAMVRACLSVLAVPYRAAVEGRLGLYDTGLLACRELDAWVISVGNITAGGTGKTPMVVWLARWLQERGVRTAILSRGYGDKSPEGLPAGGHGQGESDEILLFRRLLPGIPHLVGKDRHAAGLRAIREYGAECLLLDDGFQHLALGRDLDIVLVDALTPFGYGRLLPRGLLREPLSGLRRADLIVLTRCDLVSDEQVDCIERSLRKFRGPCPVVRAVHRPVHFLRHGTDELHSLDWAQGRKAYAFSALGNPEALPRTLRALGADLLHHEAFGDHHWYSPEDLSRIARAARQAGAEYVVTTEKDAVKIDAFPGDGPLLYVLGIELEMTRGEDLLVRALRRMVEGEAVHLEGRSGVLTASQPGA